MMLKSLQSILYLIYLINLSSAKVGNVANYRNLISKAQLYYLNPNPFNQRLDTPITKLDEPFNAKSPDIKIIIHGWNANKNHVSVAPLQYAYLANGHDAVFVADWSKASRIIYFDARYFVQPIGRRLAKLLETFMRKNNIDPSKIHIIGHSLGSHIAGNMGVYFNGTIGRITGLDPAGPFFESFVTDGLSPRNARFVDCIHTGSPTLGQTLQRGHVDFYPNYGKVAQPGCEVLDLITATACSHYRAPLLFAESIQLKYNFPSYRCPIKSISRSQCLESRAENFLFMGEIVSKSSKGSYYLRTNNVSPFGIGNFSPFYYKSKFESKTNTGPIKVTNVKREVTDISTEDQYNTIFVMMQNNESKGERRSQPILKISDEPHLIR